GEGHAGRAAGGGATALAPEPHQTNATRRKGEPRFSRLRAEGRTKAALEPVTSAEVVEALPAQSSEGWRRVTRRPLRWLGDSPLGPGDTPLPAGTSTARTVGNHCRTTSFPRWQQASTSLV